MARQIAHEIKNPLTPMRLSIQHLIRLKQEGSSKWLDHFDKIVTSLLEQIDILSNAASEFSSFSRFNTEEPVEVELNTLIKEQIVLFSTFEHIKIHFESAVRDARVNVRRTQWVRYYEPAVERGTIGRRAVYRVISIQLKDEGETYLISVSDNGQGVSRKQAQTVQAQFHHQERRNGTGPGHMQGHRGTIQGRDILYFF